MDSVRRRAGLGSSIDVPGQPSDEIPRPKEGDRILVLRREYFDMMLKKEKTIEIRHQCLSKGFWHLGHGGLIYGGIWIGAGYTIADQADWQSSHLLHRHPSATLPYKRTCALPIIAVAAISPEIEYPHCQGSIGTATFRTADITQSRTSRMIEETTIQSTADDTKSLGDKIVDKIKAEVEMAMQAARERATIAGESSFSIAAAAGEAREAYMAGLNADSHTAFLDAEGKIEPTAKRHKTTKMLFKRPAASISIVNPSMLSANVFVSKSLATSSGSTMPVHPRSLMKASSYMDDETSADGDSSDNSDGA